MLNQVTLVGRMIKEPTIEPIDDDKQIGIFQIEVPRNFKNADGEYEKDYIEVHTFNNIALNVKEYCENGDIVGIKGRVQSNKDTIQIVAEKVTFLTHKKKIDMGEE